MSRYISVGGKKYRVTNASSTKPSPGSTSSSSSSSSSKKKSSSSSGRSGKTAGEIIREARREAGGDSKKFYKSVREKSRRDTRKSRSSSGGGGSSRSSSRSRDTTAGDVIKEAREKAGGDSEKFFQQVEKRSREVGVKQAIENVPAGLSTGEARRLGKRIARTYDTDPRKTVQEVSRQTVRKEGIKKVPQKYTKTETAGEIVRASREAQRRYDIDPMVTQKFLAEKAQSQKKQQTYQPVDTTKTPGVSWVEPAMFKTDTKELKAQQKIRQQKAEKYGVAGVPIKDKEYYIEAYKQQRPFFDKDYKPKKGFFEKQFDDYSKGQEILAERAKRTGKQKTGIGLFDVFNPYNVIDKTNKVVTSKPFKLAEMGPKTKKPAKFTKGFIKGISIVQERPIDYGVMGGAALVGGYSFGALTGSGAVSTTTGRALGAVALSGYAGTKTAQLSTAQGAEAKGKVIGKTTAELGVTVPAGMLGARAGYSTSSKLRKEFQQLKRSERIAIDEALEYQKYRKQGRLYKWRPPTQEKQLLKYSKYVGDRSYAGKEIKVKQTTLQEIDPTEKGKVEYALKWQGYRPEVKTKGFGKAYIFNNKNTLIKFGFGKKRVYSVKPKGTPEYVFSEQKLITNKYKTDPNLLMKQIRSERSFWQKIKARGFWQKIKARGNIFSNKKGAILQPPKQTFKTPEPIFKIPTPEETFKIPTPEISIDWVKTPHQIYAPRPTFKPLDVGFWSATVRGGRLGTIATMKPITAQIKYPIPKIRTKLISTNVAELAAELELAQEQAMLTVPRVGQREKTIPKVAELAAELELAQDQAILTVPRVGQRQKTKVAERTAELELAQEQITKQGLITLPKIPTKLISTPKPSIPTLTKPKIPYIPDIPSWELDKKKKMSFFKTPKRKKLKRKGAYISSIVGRMSGLKTKKAPKIVTGLGVRFPKANKKWKI